jgi:hypothetical protein
MIAPNEVRPANGINGGPSFYNGLRTVLYGRGM